MSIPNVLDELQRATDQTEPFFKEVVLTLGNDVYAIASAIDVSQPEKMMKILVNDVDRLRNVCLEMVADFDLKDSEIRNATGKLPLEKFENVMHAARRILAETSSKNKKSKIESHLKQIALGMEMMGRTANGLTSTIAPLSERVNH